MKASGSNSKTLSVKNFIYPASENIFSDESGSNDFYMHYFLSTIVIRRDFMVPDML